MNKKLEQLALKDSHTGLYNHRYLKEAIEVRFSQAERQFSPFSVIMMDIDYFKSINDAYGHLFGDLVLKQFAKQLKKIVRPYDILSVMAEKNSSLSPVRQIEPTPSFSSEDLR